MKKLFVLGFVFALSFFVVLAHGEEEIGYGDHHDGMMDSGGSFWFWGMGSYVFLYGVIILILVGLIFFGGFNFLKKGNKK